MSTNNTESDIIIEYKSFDDMGLSDNLLRGIYTYGFEKPSLIQSKTIVPISNGKDVIAQSQSGTGKTGAFLIGALNKINYSTESCQVIIIVPTHELANQILSVIVKLSTYMKIKCSLCVGGTNLSDNIKNVTGSHIVIGTPGRLYDLVKRNCIVLSTVTTLIIDEADEMLSGDFKNQIQNITQELAQNSQICIFSATYTTEIINLANDRILYNPIKILMKNEELTLEGISQYYINVQQEKYKINTLCDLYKMLTISQSIIYVNSKKKADWLYTELTNKMYAVVTIHSDMTSTERYSVLQRFREGSDRVLISTDLLSRGIDIQQVSTIINFDLPIHNDPYIHRIGRSGRFGRKGLAINFITHDSKRRLNDIIKFYNTQIDEMPENLTLDSN